MSTKKLRPVVMPPEVVIFAGGEPADDMPHFPTEEAWEYIEELERTEEAGELVMKVTDEEIKCIVILSCSENENWDKARHLEYQCYKKCISFVILQ
jgi:hypothetical protein